MVFGVAERINRDVNASVKYKTDLGQYNVPEFWTVAGKYGDCEDYALLKRKMLIDALKHTSTHKGIKHHDL